MSKEYKSHTEQIKEFIEIKCKQCGSEDVYINYEKETDCSGYTQWGSSLTFYCNSCNAMLYLSE